MSTPICEFKGGYPTAATAQQAFDDVDLARAMQMHRMFYPSVSGAAIFEGNLKAGLRPNQVFGFMDTQPRHVGFTLDSDTPCGAMLLELSGGPLVIELPPGPLAGALMDIHQRWIADIGLAGPDAGHGGRHLLLPPGPAGETPIGFHAATATSLRVIGGVRAIPADGDVRGAVDRLRAVKVHPLQPSAGWKVPRWLDMTPEPQDTTPLAWEDNLQFWHVLHDVVDKEPPAEGWRAQYGDLAALGIAKGEPFRPDARMKRLLEEAAQRSCAQMRVESLADRRPDRLVWRDRQWQWAALRFENGSFDTPRYTDTYARDKWFFQAVGASPSMFRRDAGAGSLRWLGLRDRSGEYLDGGRTYKLTVPQPVPGKLFWSVTVYDAQTRSQVATDQGKAALRSLSELKGRTSGTALDLYFGPQAPAGQQGQWIRTVEGRGWFVHFRIYGPREAALDGTWRPGDFEVVQ
jgi:hypothetical protein